MGGITLKSLAKTVHRFGQGIALLLLAPLASVSQAADTAAVGNVEEIVVTGSFIKGSSEKAALPVDVVTQEDLQDVGSPSLIEFIRDLGISSGNLGETNQFTAPAQGTEGITSINLRGLGSARTLTLINGRRQVSTENNGVDVSAFPMLAFARTEILKDGAAALYGSDAIAGVVNFISQEGFEGLQLQGSNTWLDQSDGNRNFNVLYGWASDRMNAFVAMEYEHRSELQIKDKDWAIKPWPENFYGGWSGTGMPGTVYVVDPSSTPFPNAPLARGVDPGCNALGGSANFGTCYFQFSFFDNLIEKTNTYKNYAEFNYNVSDSSKLHVEGMFSRLDMPNWKSSPAYPPNSLFGPDRIIPANNPGLEQFKADYPALFPTLADGTVAADQEVYSKSRMLGVNGRDGKPLSAYRKTDTWRLATSLVGDAFDGQLGYNFGVSYSRRDRDTNGYDMQIQGMAFALNGYGGPNCFAPGSSVPQFAQGSGPGKCEWFNPFSEAIQYSAVTGPNTFNAVPAVANSPELIKWLTLEGEYHEQNELLVWDAIFNGELGYSLPGGAIGWAMGAQARNEKYNYTGNNVANRAVDPCPWTNAFAVTLGFTTPDQLAPNCTYKTGLVAFGVPNDDSNTKRTVYAVFGELALPISDTVDMQVALRFEDYGSSGGSTIDPKVAIKWQAIDWLALRGSIGTTFRGPPLSYLQGVNTFLANFSAPTNAYRAVNVVGNPDLQPERAITSNAGIIIELGGFTGTVDYWNYKFSDPLQIESYNQIFGLYSALGCSDFVRVPNPTPPPATILVPGPGLGTATCNDLRPHIEPLGASAENLAAVNVNIINGSNITTDGIDASAQYAFNLMGGELTVGTEGTYTIKYDSDDFHTLGGTILAPGGDFVGYENVGQNPFTPLPEVKGNAFVRYAHDNWRFSYTARYVSQLTDQTCRTSNACSLTGASQPLHDIDSMTTQDVTMIYTWRDLTVSGSVFNFMDKDPPQVAAAQNYDPYTHSPFGRMFKLDLTYVLGGK